MMTWGFPAPQLPLFPAQQQYEGQRHLRGLRHWKANSTLQSRVVPSVQLGLPRVSAAAVASVFDALAAPSNSTVKTFARSPYSTMRPWLQVRVKHLESSEIQAVSMFWKLKVKVSDHPSDPGPKANAKKSKKRDRWRYCHLEWLQGSTCRYLSDICTHNDERLRATSDDASKLEVQILFHAVPISRRVLYFLIHLLIHICHPRRPERGSVANRLFKSEQFKFQAQIENLKKVATV